MKNNSKKLQLHIRVSEEEMEAIDVLARLTGTTKTEAVMMAVHMCKASEEERKKRLILGNSSSDYDDYAYYEEDLVDDVDEIEEEY